ncbi:MAG: rhodanese-related sulfurtransferase [Acidimicrobiales bacterium]|jgi:rhodanese-related sulfurtransferase
MIDTLLIETAALAAWLLDGEELALLDAREQGVYFQSHLFHAASMPLSQLELYLPRQVPRKDTRIVWCDDGSAPAGTGLADQAAVRATALGWTSNHVLVGGTAAWGDTGGELYSGVNVPSKAFGEYVEHTYGTPRLSATELNERLTRGDKMVVLDSRPIEEFRSMSIPGATDCPGAELVHRVKEVVSDSDTLVVVNCAGRTRSIIGSQSLINAGLENPVVALENGTMGWELAGFEVDRGRDVHVSDPDESSRQWAEAAAASVGKRFGVREVDHDQLNQWQADVSRTTFVLDVRTPGEFEVGHLPGSSNAPGGQLVQATDEYVATRNARLVLVDDNGVRATMTASWLRQLGWHDTFVLTAALRDQTLETGRLPRPNVPTVPTIKISELADRLDEDGLVVLDVGTSLKYRRKGHIPGAWWGVRSRMAEARAAIGDAAVVVVASTDGLLAKLAVTEVQQAWPEAEVLALAGGNKSWRHAGHDMEPGFDRPTTSADDVWYKPYDHDDGSAEKHMQQYLTWEIALVDQVDRDPTVSFPVFD